MAPVIIAGLMLVWLIVTNPQSGSELTANRLRFFHRDTSESIAVGDVKHMKITHRSDGPDEVTLHLKSGRAVNVPSLCADSKLAVALRELGVREAGVG
jgi:hypothetical protein